MIFSGLLLPGLGLGIGEISAFPSNLVPDSEIHVRAQVLPPPGLVGHGKWSHGGYIRAFAHAPSPPTFYMFDRTGNLVSSVTFTVPDATAIFLWDFDRGTDGEIALCGESDSTNGQTVPFIATISPDGQASQIVRTTPYVPNLLAKAPDGTIWTVGYEELKWP